MTVSEQEPQLQKSEWMRPTSAPRLMLVTLCLIWGMTWPMMKISLNEIPPLSMRTMTAAIGGVSLFSSVSLSAAAFAYRPRGLGRMCSSLRSSISRPSAFSPRSRKFWPRPRGWRSSPTRLPIWTLLLAWLVLGERPKPLAGIRGRAVLRRHRDPRRAVGSHRAFRLGWCWRVGGGFSWAAGTVYLKWARINADPMGAAAWQLAIGFVLITACLLIFDGGLDLGSADARARWLALVFVGVMGNAVAYAMWFDIVPVVPAATAALGILGIPVLGVAIHRADRRRPAHSRPTSSALL